MSNKKIILDENYANLQKTISKKHNNSSGNTQNKQNINNSGSELINNNSVNSNNKKK
ncbi:MAG: hypothetical protein ACYCUW_01015 [bacterium]